MAFKAVAPEKLADKTFWRTVTFFDPNDSGGTTKVDFEAQFCAASEEADAALLKDHLKTAQKRDDADAAESYDLVWMRAHVKGFRGVVDAETDQPIPFADALIRVYQYRPARLALIAAYNEAMQGRRGNG